MSEYDIQAGIVMYIRARYPDVIFTATLGGLKMSIGMAMKIKRAGYEKGIPDILILEPRRGFHGMAMEVKMPRQKPTPEQEDKLQRLHRKGYMAIVVWSVQQAMGMIDEYMA